MHLQHVQDRDARLAEKVTGRPRRSINTQAVNSAICGVKKSGCLTKAILKSEG